MKWYNNKKKPKNWMTVIIAEWYDGWNYDIGYYISETNQVMSIMHSEMYDFDDVYIWAKLKEPKSL